ncbi:hypothetical protein C1646_770264 [Rhizophagus diaphanus]|nr:hypothetical protein C1646_770264 [Rhizophagus diaphanus] [Rhizophagus sp. MUCL 43196]
MSHIIFWQSADIQMVGRISCVNNFDLRKQLVQEETNNISNKEKIRKLTNEIKACERYIFYLEKNLVSREDNLVQLKAKCQSTIYKLKKCQNHLKLKEEALVIQDKRIIQLEDTVVNLKKCIQEISVYQNRIPVPNDIDDIFTAFTQSLDEIIRQAALMQEIGIDQKNQIEGLQVLLGESLECTNGLNQDLYPKYTSYNIDIWLIL